MKKWICAGAAALLAVSMLSGCSGRSGSSSAQAQTTQAQTESQTESAKAEENVIRLLFSDQKLIAVAEMDLQPAWFSAPVLRKIYERVLELNRNDQMVDVLSFEGWLEPNEMSLLSAILEPGIPAGEHRGELQEYINTIRMQRVKDGTITQAGEDPLLTFGRIKKQNAGGQTI